LPVKERAVEKPALQRPFPQADVSDVPSATADQSEYEEYVDLESYLNTFNTEDAEDVERIEGIYNIGELLSGNNPIEDLAPPPTPTLNPPSPVIVTPPPAPSATPPVEPSPTPVSPVVPPAPTPPQSLLQQQASLKQKAMNVLANYVRQGDLVVQTEVLKNAQGQEINRKIVNIQRGCPSWAIAQIERLKREVSTSATLGQQD
jgi:hypothetical protein